MPMEKFEKVKGHPEHGHFYEMVQDKSERARSLSNEQHAEQYPELYMNVRDYYNFTIQKSSRKRIISFSPFKRDYKYVIAIRIEYPDNVVHAFVTEPLRLYDRLDMREKRRLEHRRHYTTKGGLFNRRLFNTYKEAEKWIERFKADNDKILKETIGWGGDGNYYNLLKDGSKRAIYN